jgi:HPt (histidine-containing phosphotransfer) domain-containing protein
MSSESERAAQLEALLNEAWKEHRAEVVGRVTELQDVFRALQAGALNLTARTHANSTAHKVAGVLGTFGLREASRAGLEIETLLAGAAPISPEKMREYERHLGVIGEGLMKRDRQAEQRSE